MTREELEKKAKEERSYYTDMPPYCRYPDCFHCPYNECGWDGVGKDKEIQDIIKGFSQIDNGKYRKRKGAAG